MTSLFNACMRVTSMVAVLLILSCKRETSQNKDAQHREHTSSKGDNIEIDLDFSKSQGVEFEGFLGYGSPVESQPDLNLGKLPDGVTITESRIEMPVFKTDPDVLKNEAEQDGTGQPATRPESKSGGSDIPEPEAEGRSR